MSDGVISSSEIVEAVDDFESTYKEMLAAIAEHGEEEGFTEGILRLSEVDSETYAIIDWEPRRITSSRITPVLISEILRIGAEPRRSSCQ